LSDGSDVARLVHALEEITMKPFDRPTQRVTFRSGTIVVAAMMVLALSSTSGRRVGLVVLAATTVGVPETVADQSQGVPLATIRELARHWATDRMHSLTGRRHRLATSTLREADEHRAMGDGRRKKDADRSFAHRVGEDDMDERSMPLTVFCH
jgi:hypothetical protein